MTQRVEPMFISMDVIKNMAMPKAAKILLMLLGDIIKNHNSLIDQPGELNDEEEVILQKVFRVIHNTLLQDYGIRVIASKDDGMYIDASSVYPRLGIEEWAKEVCRVKQRLDEGEVQ